VSLPVASSYRKPYREPRRHQAVRNVLIWNLSRNGRSTLSNNASPSMTGKRKRGTAINPTKTPKRRKTCKSIIYQRLPASASRLSLVTTHRSIMLILTPSFSSTFSSSVFASSPRRIRRGRILQGPNCPCRTRCWAKDSIQDRLGRQRSDW
jgi:hypothetical protein